MKTILALIFVSALYLAEAKSFGAPVVVAKRDVAGQAELLAKLAALLTKSGGVVAMLEKEGKPLLAAGIKKVEDLLKGLEEKVKNANPHTEIGKLALKALDELILKAEEELEKELKKIEGTTGFKTVAKRGVADQAELLAKLAALLGKSNGVIAMLEKEGKPLLAAGIKKIEDLLKGLEEKVKNANPHTEIGKLALKALDELILKAEEELEKELKKIEGTTGFKTVAKREIVAQAELLLKLAELLSKSKLAQELLEKEGKPLLAAGLKKIDELLHSLEEKVKNASPHTEIGKLALKALDDLILKAEEKLEEELKKLQPSGGLFVVKRDVAGQAELLAKLAALLTKSGGVVAMLEKEGKPLLAAGIKKVEDLLKSLEEKVKNANPHTEIGKLALKALDELILKAEEELEKELKKIEGTAGFKTVAKRGVADQAELLAKLAALLGKSNGVIAMLEKEGKPLLAAGIKKIEDLLKGLEEKVKNANPHTEIGKLALKALDELILKAEEELEKELKKIEGTTGTKIVAKRALGTQAELLLKLAELLSKSKLAQELLEKEGKPLLAAGLKKVDELLHSLDEKVRNANPHTEIGKVILKGLDWLIVAAEHKLEEELQKLAPQPTSAPVFYEGIDLKDGLLKTAEQLKEAAKTAIAFLKSQGKSIEAAELQLLETVVTDIEQKLETLQPHTELGKLLLTSLEGLLKEAETKLDDLLKKLNAHP